MCHKVKQNNFNTEGHNSYKQIQERMCFDKESRNKEWRTIK